MYVPSRHSEVAGDEMREASFEITSRPRRRLGGGHTDGVDFTDFKSIKCFLGEVASRMAISVPVRHLKTAVLSWRTVLNFR
eukprot:SAG11_NODE_1662_length_4497_cov_2.281492_8_plen_81_part_00